MRIRTGYRPWFGLLLSPRAVAQLRRWIRTGAVYPTKRKENE